MKIRKECSKYWIEFVKNIETHQQNYEMKVKTILFSLDSYILYVLVLYVCVIVITRNHDSFLVMWMKSLTVINYINITTK